MYAEMLPTQIQTVQTEALMVEFLAAHKLNRVIDKRMFNNE